MDFQRREYVSMKGLRVVGLVEVAVTVKGVSKDISHTETHSVRMPDQPCPESMQIERITMMACLHPQWVEMAVVV